MHCHGRGFPASPIATSAQCRRPGRRIKDEPKAVMRLVALLMIATAAAAAPPAGKRTPTPAATLAAPLTGSWAGDGFALRSAGSGYVVQGKCAAGKISGTVVPDAAGAFTAAGYFNPQRPVRLSLPIGSRDQLPVVEPLSQIAPRDRAALFKGQISGNKLTLLVRIAGSSGDTRHVLKRGAAIRFKDCS
jgi:hypothetical protein